MQCSRDSGRVIELCKISKFCLVDCTEVCPCYDNCPNGCPCKYESDYCSTTEETCHLENADEIKRCDNSGKCYSKFCSSLLTLALAKGV